MANFIICSEANNKIKERAVNLDLVESISFLSKISITFNLASGNKIEWKYVSADNQLEDIKRILGAGNVNMIIESWPSIV